MRPRRNQLTRQRLSFPAMANGLAAARKLKSRLAAITMNRLGLRYVSTDELTIRRKRVGETLGDDLVGVRVHHQDVTA